MNTRLIRIFFKISKAIQQEPIYFFGSLGKILMDLNTDNFLLAGASQEFTTYNKLLIFRYSRASKNQLRPYEKCATGEIDHKATIKEYSRSSADQQIAHLHELRPSNVLQTAMNHLLCNAIGQAHDMFSRIFRIRIYEFLVLIFSNALN